jgi:hypothetical protein
MRTSTRGRTQDRWDKYSDELAGGSKSGKEAGPPPRTPKEWATRERQERKQQQQQQQQGKAGKQGGNAGGGRSRRRKRKSSLLVSEASVPGALSPEFRPIALPVLARKGGPPPALSQQPRGPESGGANTSPKQNKQQQQKTGFAGSGGGRGGGHGGGSESARPSKSRGRMAPHVLVSSAAPPLAAGACPSVRSLPALSPHAERTPHSQRQSRFASHLSGLRDGGGRGGAGGSPSPSPERAGLAAPPPRRALSHSRRGRERGSALGQLAPAGQEPRPLPPGAGILPHFDGGAAEQFSPALLPPPPAHAHATHGAAKSGKKQDRASDLAAWLEAEKELALRRSRTKAQRSKARQEELDQEAAAAAAAGGELHVAATTSPAGRRATRGQRRRKQQRSQQRSRAAGGGPEAFAKVAAQEVARRRMEGALADAAEARYWQTEAAEAEAAARARAEKRRGVEMAGQRGRARQQGVLARKERRDAELLAQREAKLSVAAARDARATRRERAMALLLQLRYRGEVAPPLLHVAQVLGTLPEEQGSGGDAGAGGAACLPAALLLLLAGAARAARLEAVLAAARRERALLRAVVRVQRRWRCALMRTAKTRSQAKEQAMHRMQAGRCGWVLRLQLRCAKRRVAYAVIANCMTALVGKDAGPGVLAALRFVLALRRLGMEVRRVQKWARGFVAARQARLTALAKCWAAIEPVVCARLVKQRSQRGGMSRLAGKAGCFAAAAAAAALPPEVGVLGRAATLGQVLAQLPKAPADSKAAKSQRKRRRRKAGRKGSSVVVGEAGRGEAGGGGGSVAASRRGSMVSAARGGECIVKPHARLLLLEQWLHDRRFIHGLTAGTAYVDAKSYYKAHVSGDGIAEDVTAEQVRAFVHGEMHNPLRPQDDPAAAAEGEGGAARGDAMWPTFKMMGAADGGVAMVRFVEEAASAQLDEDDRLYALRAQAEWEKMSNATGLKSRRVSQMTAFTAGSNISHAGAQELALAAAAARHNMLAEGLDGMIGARRPQKKGPRAPPIVYVSPLKKKTKKKRGQQQQQQQEEEEEDLRAPRPPPQQLDPQVAADVEFAARAAAKLSAKAQGDEEADFDALDAIANARKLSTTASRFDSSQLKGLWKKAIVKVKDENKVQKAMLQKHKQAGARRVSVSFQQE